MRTILTNRQREVAIMIAEGRPRKEVARALGISTATVRMHINNIGNWAGASKRADLLRYAIDQGLILAEKRDLEMSERERTIVSMLLDGFSQSAAAVATGLSLAGVGLILRRMRRRVGVNRTPELLRRVAGSL